MDGMLNDRPHGEARRDPYATIAELYDLEHAGFDDDVEMYRQFAYATGDPILELACGSGRILTPLAADGHRVTGLDRSGPMLDRARLALSNLEPVPEYHLVEADMTAAATATSAPFGLVIVGLNSFLHAETSEEQRQILTTARLACDPRGQLIIDVLNPTPEHLQALSGTALDGQWELPSGDRVMKFSDRRLSSANQTITTTIWYDIVGPDGTLRRETTGFTLRYLHRSELLLMLEFAGWVDFEVYGSYDLDPVSDSSERLIVTAQRTPSERFETRVIG